MGQIQTIALAVKTTGEDGAATGEVESEVLNGHLLDVYLDYAATAPATTNVGLDTVTRGVGHVLTVLANATDGLYAPRMPVCDDDGAAIAGVYDRVPLTGKLKLSVAACNALDPAVTAYIRYLMD